MTKWKCDRCDSACILDIGKGDYMDDPQICPFDPNIPEWKKLKSELKFDSVTKPSHYCEGRQYEPLAVIEDWGLDFHLGNTVKYISRAGRKNDILEDLNKAKFYLERKIEQIEKERAI